MMSNKSEKSKNDIAWESLFETHNILEEINKNGVYKISAKAINTKREARLMTKFDHHIQLPSIFKQNHLTIQPDSRGSYIIGRFKSYESLPKESFIDITEIPFPSYLETINPTNIYSESCAILCAYNTGMIDDLLNEETKFTVSGRMSTGRFSYLINSTQDDTSYEINVDNSQCEIDSGFEGDNILAIIEAKNQTVDDFLVRQLYYPYRLWKNKTQKQVIPIFLFYSNDIFSFYIYRFTDDNYYNSIELVNQKKYQIGSNDIELEDILSILERVKIKPENKLIPFPQADSFVRIVDLIMQIYNINTSLSQEDITSNYAFDVRQAQYYTNAAIYLDLVQKTTDREQGVIYSITERGVNIIERTPKRRNLALVECILEKRVLNQTLQLYLQKGSKPTLSQVVEIMLEAELDLSLNTMSRRGQTVLAWIDWIMGLTQL
jgi:hypothetical protein